MSDCESVEVRDSLNRAAGEGLFARHDFERGARVATFTGPIVDIATLSNEERRYAVAWSGDTVLNTLASNGGDSLAHKANCPHGDPLRRRANTRIVLDRRNKQATLRATCAIKAGDEILVCYGAGYTRALARSCLTQGVQE